MLRETTRAGVAKGAGRGTHRLHCSSFLGFTLSDSKYEPQKGTTKEPMGSHLMLRGQVKANPSRTHDLTYREIGHRGPETRSFCELL